MKKVRRWVLGTLPVVVATAGVLFIGASTAHAQLATKTISAGDAGARSGTFTIRDSSLGNIGQLSFSGTRTYNYVATFFTASASQTYTFGQTSNPVDTVMILYNGNFNDASPATNALALNDDTPQSTHAAVGATVSSCGSPSYCPQVSASLTAGQQVTLVITTYSFGSALAYPQTFYGVGAGSFSDTAPSPPSSGGTPDIDASYTTTQLGSGDVNPTFAGGTLTVAAAGSFSNNFDVQSGGGTVNNDGLDATFSGVFSGAGGMTFSGAGVTTLSGANTYSGGTTVSGGTLKGTTTSLQGAITNNATTEFAQNTNGTYAGVMSGTGALVTSGTGVVTLTGVNAYTGNTTVGSGSTLALSGSGSIGASSVVTNNGTFSIGDTTNGASITSLAGSGATTLGSKTLTITNGSSTFGGVISGTGGLTVSGGTQTLSGENTYTGGTTVSGGTLKGTTTSLQGAITNNATTQFDQGTNGTYAGVMSGSGTLVKTGDGVLTLSGANTYSGGTTVSGGTLKGNTTSLQGAITNNATTEFSQTTTGTYSGVMSGTGSLVKTGSGTVTLSGNNSYTGGTTVLGGTLAGTSGSISGDVTNNANVQFDQSTNGTYAGSMTGTGALVKSGSGLLTLSNLVNLSGNATVVGGGLKVFGTASFSNLLCGGTSATSLYGTGRINGGVVVGAGCTLAPGASPGTLTFGGNVTLAAGSFYSVEIDGKVYNAAGGAGTYDRAVLSTAGSVFTAGGTLAPKLRGLEGAANNNFTATFGDRFTIVTGANAGEFASVSQPTAGLVANSRFDVLYGTSNIDLIVTPNSFAVLGQGDGWTQNAISAAAGYDATRPAAGARTGASVALFNSLYQAPRASLGATFHQMSGQIFADAIQSARFTIENAQDSILGASINDFGGTESGEVAVWADIIGRNAEGNNDGTALGYDDEMKGVAAGIALGLGESSHLGIGTSYGSSKLEAALGSRADVDVKTLYGFGGGKLSDSLSYSVMAGVSKYDAATTRELTIANVTTRAKGLGSGGSKQLGAYLRFSQPAYGSSRVSVTGGVQSYWFNTKTITENVAAADGGLTVATQNWKQTQGVLNAEWVIGSGHIRGVLFGELQYDFDENAASDRRKVMNSYGASWFVSAPEVERTQNTVGVGLHADLGDSSGLRLELTNSNRGDGFSDKGGFLRLFFNR